MLLVACSPQAVRGLVLVNAQGFTSGVAPLWRPLAVAGVMVLQQVWLRDRANQVRGEGLGVAMFEWPGCVCLHACLVPLCASKCMGPSLPAAFAMALFGAARRDTHRRSHILL